MELRRKITRIIENLCRWWCFNQVFCALLDALGRGPVPTSAELDAVILVAYWLTDGNTIEIISIGLINICLLLFGSIQTYQSFKWIRRINLQIDLDFNRYMTTPTDLANLHLPMTVLYAEIVQLAFLVLFVAASIFFGYKLYGEFGWNIYKKIGAGINTQYAAHNIHTIIIQSVFVAIVIPTLGLGLWGVRSENKVALLIYAICSVATIVNFLYILASFIVQRDESLLTFLDILGITLIIMSLVTAYLAYNNF
ncbi:2060_t:CDS:2, partial [Gigaspora rosea]